MFRAKHQNSGDWYNVASANNLIQEHEGEGRNTFNKRCYKSDQPLWEPVVDPSEGETDYIIPRPLDHNGWTTKMYLTNKR
jgi:hypothetical protein